MTNSIMTNELMKNELMTNDIMTNVTEPNKQNWLIVRSKNVFYSRVIE